MCVNRRKLSNIFILTKQIEEFLWNFHTLTPYEWLTQIIEIMLRISNLSGQH